MAVCYRLLFVNIFKPTVSIDHFLIGSKRVLTDPASPTDSFVSATDMASDGHLAHGIGSSTTGRTLREKETDRQQWTDRQQQTNRERQTDSDRQTDNERQTERERDRPTVTDRQTTADKQRETEREGGGMREKEIPHIFICIYNRC